MLKYSMSIMQRRNYKTNKTYELCSKNWKIKVFFGIIFFKKKMSKKHVYFNLQGNNL